MAKSFPSRFLLTLSALCLMTLQSLGADMEQKSFIDEELKHFKLLKPFGYEVFQEEKLDTGMALDTFRQEKRVIETVPPDYLIKSNDEIVIDMWGELDLQYMLSVDKDGYISIPNVGRVYVRGDSYQKAKEKIRGKLANSYQMSLKGVGEGGGGSGGTVIDIAMGKVSGVKLYVTGEVFKPGIVEFSGPSASILSAIRKAGGVKPLGSLREITVTPPGAPAFKVDLYDFLIEGALPTDYKFLTDGALIFVPMKSKEVYIDGAIARPAIYELKGKDDLGNVLAMAGGLLPNASREKAQIIRDNYEQGTKVLDIKIQNGDFHVPLWDDDRISIPFTPRKRIEEVVKIEGQGVRSPGIYQFAEGMTLRDLLQTAGGLRPDALLSRADLIRTKSDLSKDIELIDLEKVGTGTNAKFELRLRPMDQLITYSKYEMRGGEPFIRIEGHVKRPGDYALPENVNLYDLLFLSGGFDDPQFKKETFLERADLVRLDEKTQKKMVFPFNLKTLLETEKSDALPPLRPGDKIQIYSYKDIFGKGPVITVEGQVKNPGEYPLYENATIKDVLFMAGGFDDANFRKDIYLERADIFRVNPKTQEEQVIAFDLSAALNGKAPSALKLEGGDRLKVYSRDEMAPRSSVFIEGEVTTAGRYVYRENMSLRDLVARAGNITPLACLEKIDVIRTRKDAGQSVQETISVDFTNAEGRNFPLRDGDKVVVLRDELRAEGDTLSVNGEVKYPGSYARSRQETLSSLVARAGGLTEQAFLAGAELLRDDKRLIIRLSDALSAPNSDANILLNAGDILNIPRVDRSVAIIGAVLAPRKAIRVSGKKADYYIEIAGGYAPEADRGNVKIISPEGEYRDAFTFWYDPEVPAGGTVYVPELKKEPDMEQAQLAIAEESDTTDTGRAINRFYKSPVQEPRTPSKKPSAAPDLLSAPEKRQPQPLSLPDHNALKNQIPTQEGAPKDVELTVNAKKETDETKAAQKKPASSRKFWDTEISPKPSENLR